MNEAIKTAIENAQQILLHCHPSPDPDSYGSALGMYHYLKSIGKGATVIKGDSPIPDFAEFLPGADQIVAKNYLEITPTDYDLFIILDSGAPERVSALGPVTFPATMKTVLIDHHATTTNFATVSWVDPTYAATAEMLADLFVTWQAVITPETARCLIVGMYTDTGGFKYYPSTTARTLRLAAKMAEIAPDYGRIIAQMENNHPPESIRFQALALSVAQNYFTNQVTISALSHEQLQAAGLAEDDTRISIPNVLKSVRGCEIGISLYEWVPGITKLSSRARNGQVFDLTKFVTLVGGGGHRAAAGAIIKLPLAEAKELALKKLPEAYPQLLDAK